MTIYTDGATSNNGAADAVGGWAFVVVGDPEISCSGHVENATNNICELMALIEGCKYANVHRKPHEVCIIYADSAYCINCYKQRWYEKWQLNGWKNSKHQPVANRDLWEQLIPYFEQVEFSFDKVKGHDGNKYNERADELAVAAKEKM